MNINSLPAVLTIQDAANYLNRSTMTIRRRIWSGTIRSYRDGQEHRIRREWLLEYEQSLVGEQEEGDEINRDELVKKAVKKDKGKIDSLSAIEKLSQADICLETAEKQLQLACQLLGYDTEISDKLLNMRTSIRDMRDDLSRQHRDLQDNLDRDAAREFLRRLRADKENRRCQ